MSAAKRKRRAARWVYPFGNGKAAGGADKKDLLGGKGANLGEMTRLGIPVPPGFTITTAACIRFFERRGRLPEGLKEQVGRALQQLERRRGQRFGDLRNPLLVSVRSGAKFSMPGMMDTVLNLGLSDSVVVGLAERSGNARFAWDSYRRFIQMYGDVVLDTGKAPFEDAIEALKRDRGVASDAELTAADLKRLCSIFRKIVLRRAGTAFPQDAHGQLWGAITAVFRSWNNARAKRYRRQYGIPESLGTAVNVQSMVFGNLGADCATGVAFTRDPATGEDVLYGEWLPDAQGEDVVAGIRTPLPISTRRASAERPSLEQSMPEAFAELQRIRKTLEAHYRDMQDVEFTVERGRLYMLQTRTGKRTGLAALHIAFDLHAKRVLGKEEVVARVEPEMLVHLLAPVFDPHQQAAAREDGRMLGRGLPAGPGAACGAIAFDAERAERLRADGRSVLLVRTETSPEDLGGMVAASGILTGRGGMTSHAAVVARGMGKPCIVGAEVLRIDEKAGVLRARSMVFREGDDLSIDGSTGEVFVGRIEPRPSEIQSALISRRRAKKPAPRSTLARFTRLMRWADSIRRLKVRTNADTPHDARVARALGAEGIGLCRTEHMFFAEDRILAVREMILAADREGRDRALRKLLPMQRRDFVGIFKAMDGRPVTIRLLDPPLHEFLPTEDAQFRALAEELGVSKRALSDLAEQLHESNPMLGHRGCRLGLSYPEIYEMQAQAIFEAAIAVRRRGVKVAPEVMIPLVGTVVEFDRLAARVRAVAEATHRKAGVRPVRYPVGTMIEVPRACLTADAIGRSADFFSFGTNDLTQMTFGFSRDDVAKFLPEYLEHQVLPADPFAQLDEEGVGRLVRLAVKEGREGSPGLKIGICGEHGGDPPSVRFFHRLGMDYVSCSPFRIPVARLAAAHCVLEERGEAGSGTS